MKFKKHDAMKNYIKINKFFSIRIQKNYKLNNSYDELISKLEKYYSQKKRFMFLPKSGGFLIKRKFGFFNNRITDRWNVNINFKYLQKDKELELLLLSKISNIIFLLFILMSFITFIFIVSGFKIEIFGFLFAGWLFVMFINIITKYNACTEVIKEFEMLINEKLIL